MSSTSHKLIKGSAFRTINFISQIVVTLFLMPFVVHNLGDRLYGFWSLIGVFIGYYGLLDLGLATAVNKHISGAIGSDDRDECNRIFNTAFSLYLGLGIIALIISFIIAGFAHIIAKNPEDASLFSKAILILGLNMAIGFPIRAFDGILTSQLRYDIISGIQFMTLILRTALIVVVLSAGYKVLALAVVTLLASIPGKIIIIHFSKKNLPFIRLNFRDWTRKNTKTLYSYGAYTFIAQLAYQLKFHIDPIVITSFMGLASVTHYRVGGRLVHYYDTLISRIMDIFLPVFSRQDGAKDYESLKKTFFFASRISICISTFIGFGLILWGKPFIQVWMGPEYLDAYPVLVILVMGFLFALWQRPSLDLIFGTAKHKIYSLLSLGEGVFNLLLSLILVRYYGLIGVAVGTLVPMIIMKVIIQPVYVCRVSSIDYGEYVSRMLKTAVIACVSLAIPTIMSLYFVAPDYSVLFPLGFVSLICYSFMVWFIDFTSEERQILYQSIFPRLIAKRSAR